LLMSMVCRDSGWFCSSLRRRNSEGAQTKTNRRPITSKT
jgi:hypothetical protein